VNQINHENYLMVLDLKNGASLKNELSTFKAYVKRSLLFEIIFEDYHY